MVLYYIIETLTNLERNRAFNLIIRIATLLIFVQVFLQYFTKAENIDILYRKDICDEEEFYEPYVRLLRTRQPYHEKSPILKLLSPGYIDVSRHTGILCINGPAIVYTDLKEESKKCPKTSSSNLIPSNGEPQVFNHDCFSINRLGRDLYKSADLQGLKKDSRVYGNKVFGVFLIGVPPDYRYPNFIFLPRPDFGYKPNNSWCIHEGASLAFITNDSDSSTHCYKVRKYNMEGTVSANYPGIPMFCFREDKDDSFDTPFHKETEKPLTYGDITWDEDPETCGGMDQISDTSQSKQAFEPMPRQLTDFRMIDPVRMTDRGSQPVMWRPKRVSVDSVIDLHNYNKESVDELFDDEPSWKGKRTHDDETTALPHEKFQAELLIDDCEEVPSPSDTCTTDLPSSCTILNQVLTLEETDWKDAIVREGSWRTRVLDTVNKIYEKACPQVSKYLSSSLSRVFQHLLFEEIKANASIQPEFNAVRNPEWIDIMAYLNDCASKVKVMNFFKKKDVSALKLKKKLEAKLESLYQRISHRIALKGASAKAANEASPSSSSDSIISSTLGSDTEHLADLVEVEKIQMQLSEIPLQFPYKILIGSPNKKGYDGATQVYKYREAAELDYEFDWALDSYWKVITTVLGYCQIHDQKKDIKSFKGIYDRFIVDFFRFISKAWIKGDNRQVYEQVFGDFIHGSGALWIDACHNGAYQWSDTVESRPLRPLDLLEGELPPAHLQTSGLTGPANFFLDNPIHSNLNTDHYDYYDDTDKGKAGDAGSPELYDHKTTRLTVRHIITETVEGINDPVRNLV